MKKQKIYPYRSLAVLLLIASSFISYGQFKDEKSTVKSSPFNPKGKVTITNKHGAINVISWAKDSIRVKGIVEGSSKSLERLTESMAKTSMNIKLEKNVARITTQILENSFDKGFSEIRKIAGIQNEISINYTIWVPKTAMVSIANKFGDIYLDDHLGDLNLDISHGNLRAHNINKISYLNASFGNLYFISLKELKANLQFTQMDIEKGGELSIDSKGGTFEFEQIEKLDIQTSNDRIDIESVNHLELVGTLSKVKIKSLNNSGDFNLKYGKVRINKIQKEVCDFNIASIRSTFDLGFTPECKYTIAGNQTDVEIDILGPNAKENKNGEIVIGNVVAGQNHCVLAINSQKSKLFFR